MNKKINKLTLALKVCLVVILITTLIDSVPAFMRGYNETTSKMKLESRKQTVFVQPIKDSILQQNEKFAVTAISAIQIQDAKDGYSWSGLAFGIFIIALGIYGLVLFIRIFKLSFKLINKIETLQLLEIDNIPLIKKLGNTLIIFGSIGLVAGIGLKFYIDHKYVDALIGYKPSQPIDLDFSYIILGIVVLIAASIINETINLKYEQSLTV